MTPYLQLKDTLHEELSELSQTEDVFDQLLELHEKFRKTYNIQLELEDFGKFVKKTFRRRDFKHLQKTLAQQKANVLKPEALDELETKEVETELRRLIARFDRKNFIPSNNHLQQCLGTLDDAEDLKLPADPELLFNLKTLLQKTYGEQNETYH